MAVTVLGASGVVLSAGAWANQTMSATTWVNVRSGPGTSYGVLGVLNPAQTVTSSTSQGGWHKVTASNGLTGWVYKTYLKTVAGGTDTGAGSGSTGNTGTSTSPATGTARAISAVNIRSGASWPRAPRSPSPARSPAAGPRWCTTAPTAGSRPTT